MRDGVIRILNKVLNLRARNERFCLVIDHRGEYVSQSAAISFVASKFPITPETLLSWVRQTEIDQRERVGLSTNERDKLARLEH